MKTHCEQKSLNQAVEDNPDLPVQFIRDALEGMTDSEQDIGLDEFEKLNWKLVLGSKDKRGFTS